MVTLIVCYTIPLLSSFSFTHTCHPEEQALVGYATFECIHVISSLMRKLVVAYLTLLGLYGLLNVYTLSWILHRSVCTCMSMFHVHNQTPSSFLLFPTHLFASTFFPGSAPCGSILSTL